MANGALAQPPVSQTSPPFRAWFGCSAGCSGELPLNQIIYYCPKCGSLLDVQHDLDALRTRSASEWKNLFDDRYRRTTYPYGSGVWGKKEMVCPAVDDDNVVSTYEGSSNLFGPSGLAIRLASETCGSSSVELRIPDRLKTWG